MTSPRATDAINTEIIGNRLQSIGREMLLALIRSAFSPNVKERYDCGCGIFNRAGDQVALAAYPPLHFAGMRKCVRQLLSDYDLEDIRPGDMFIGNDPYSDVSTHLPDVVLIAPAFVDGSLVGFVASTAHHSDIGGRVPGGQAPDSKSIYEEGLQLPLVRIVRDNEFVPDVLKVFRANVRTAEERTADLRAQFAANRIGVQRLVELCQRYGLDEFESAATDWIDAADKSLAGKLRRLPSTPVSYEELIEDDLSDEPKKLRVEITCKDGRLLADFTGTSPAFEGAKNIPPNATVAVVWMTLKSVLDPGMPPNEGGFRRIDVRAPLGSIVNPRYPSAIGERALSCQVLADVVMGALAKLVPDRALAECGPHHGLNFSGIVPWSGRYFTNHESFAGGMGARRSSDGISACRVHVSGSANLPVESLEAELPIVIRRYELRRDSGGAGRWRGGLGLRRDMEVVADELTVTLRGERQVIAAKGRDGGLSGALGEFVLNPDSARETRLPMFVSGMTLRRGDVLSVRTPGGGGIGPPSTRSPERILDDVRLGYVSERCARELYGADVEQFERTEGAENV